MEEIKNYLERTETENLEHVMENAHLVFEKIEGKEITTEALNELLIYNIIKMSKELEELKNWKKKVEPFLNDSYNIK